MCGALYGTSLRVVGPHTLRRVAFRESKQAILNNTPGKMSSPTPVPETSGARYLVKILVNCNRKPANYEHVGCVKSILQEELLGFVESSYCI